MILENIKSPADVKALGEDRVDTLCDEIRSRIIGSVSVNGGHLSSNLGDVELTVAMHRVFDTPKDSIIFDVGHQSYAHKLLTGRQEGFANLRNENGVSGFTKRSESEYDPFGSGHSGNALSAAIGIATAKKLACGADAGYTVAVIGDGGFTNGMTYEALNNCAGLKLIIVLNDNEMAISHNVGTIDNIFSRMRTSKGYFRLKNRIYKWTRSLPLIGKPLTSCLRGIKNFFKHLVLKENFFETLGCDYYGPVDGNDVKRLSYVFRQAKLSDRVCVVHAYTKKGKGYAYAEEKPDSYHSVGRFDPATGIVPNGKELTFSYNAGKVLAELAAEDGKICAVTAAMTAGTGLTGFAEKFPERFFDVGIAEEHAVTFCAGLAAEGFRPVFAVYSTFLQRTFDQIAEDAAMQRLAVTLLVDRAGIIGDDGITHHGIFDVALLNAIPGITVWSPDSLSELPTCIRACVGTLSAVRYPKGKEREYDRSRFISGKTLKYADFGTPDKVLFTYGGITSEVFAAAEKHGNVRLVKLLRIKPLDIGEISAAAGDLPAVFVEEGTEHGGIAEALHAAIPNEMTIRAIDGELPEHGRNAYLYKKLGIDAESVAALLDSLQR